MSLEDLLPMSPVHTANIEVFAELRDAEATGGRQTDKLKLLIHWGYFFLGHTALLAVTYVPRLSVTYVPGSYFRSIFIDVSTVSHSDHVNN